MRSLGAKVPQNRNLTLRKVFAETFLKVLLKRNTIAKYNGSLTSRQPNNMRICFVFFQVAIFFCASCLRGLSGLPLVSRFASPIKEACESSHQREINSSRIVMDSAYTQLCEKACESLRGNACENALRNKLLSCVRNNCAKLRKKGSRKTL